MKRLHKFVLACGLALLALGVVGWTQNSASEWFKGIIYAGSSKVQLTTSAGNLSTTTGAFSSTLSVTGASTLSGAAACGSTLSVTGASTLTGAATLAGLLNLTDVGTVGATGPTGSNGNSPTHLVTKVTAGGASLNVTLPTAATGLVRMVGNTSSQTVGLYPFTGDAINASVADQVLSMTTGKTYLCVATDADHWICSGN